MYCQRVIFWIFLFIYIVTGIILGIGAALLHTTKLGDNNFASHISVPGRYYIAGASIYVFITGVVHLIISACCKKNYVCFRLSIFLLTFGIIIELIATGVIAIISIGYDSDTRKNTLITIGSLTAYLFVLQVYGIIAGVSYHAEERHNYEKMPLK
jgi:hypothetical protein